MPAFPKASNSIVLQHLRKDLINMLTSILGAQLSWHFASGWVFEPAIVGPDSVEYSLKEGPHAGRHAIQHFCYQRIAPGVETTAWYEESGAVVHMTWYLQTLFLADTTTMTDADYRLLALDLYAEPGRTFRLPPRWYADVSDNLAIANMDFAEFADATDGSGTFRGFDGGK
jgi:hypothetical protein